MNVEMRGVTNRRLMTPRIYERTMLLNQRGYF